MEVKYGFDNKSKEFYSGGEKMRLSGQGVGKYLFEQMKKHAESNLIAQIEGETGIEETYQDLLQKCIKLALFMKDQGLKQGDIISMCSQNTLHNLAVLIASFFIGVIIASTDPLISVEDTRILLDKVKPKLIFVCEKSFQLITNALGKSSTTKIVSLYQDESMSNLMTILNQYTQCDIELFEPITIIDTKDMALIMFSSGTTGMPKGVCFSYENLGTECCINNNLSAGTRLYGFTTLYWTTSIFLFLQCVSNGISRIHYRERLGAAFWDELDRREVTFVFLPYSHCIDLLQHLKRPMPYLKTFLILGGQIPPNLYIKYIAKLPNVIFYQAYGMTEICAVSGHVIETKCPLESAGKIFPKNLVIKIVNPDTETPLDLNRVGEIRVKGANEMIGYYKEDSSHCWDKQGFFKTGDLGYLDNNCYLYVVDRIKEMFKYNGWHVIPGKIEAVLLQHTAVQRAIVIGVPVDYNNHAMAVVVLKDSYLIASEELLEFVNSRVDDLHQIRAGLKFINENEIPFTPNGKINRRKLMDLFSN